MNEIARFTTPSLWFKPSSVEATDISKIFLVLSQDGNEILRKDITQAQICSNISNSRNIKRTPL